MGWASTPNEQKPLNCTGRREEGEGGGVRMEEEG